MSADVDTIDLPFGAPVVFARPDERPIMGIDPGMYGGVAFVYDTGGLVCYDMPLVGPDVDIEQLCAWIKERKPRLAAVERAASMPKQGIASTFRYGVAVGSIRGAIIASEIPLERIAVRTWKQHFNLDKDKEKSRALALNLWPGTGFFGRVKDHGRAEAALIARFVMETANRKRGVR